MSENSQEEGNKTIRNDNKFIISSSLDKTISLWNLEMRVQVSILNGHTEAVGSIAITNDYNSGSDDRSVMIWDFQPKIQTAILK